MRFFSQKLCICIALNDTFLSIVATTVQKELAKPQSQIPNLFFRKGNNKFNAPSLYFYNLETWISCTTEIS